jgi:hypothetical protein
MRNGDEIAARRTIFEAALLGAAELPDDVAGLALDLAERRPAAEEEAAAPDRRTETEPSGAPMPAEQLAGTPRRRPFRWPRLEDGPWRGVDEGFRSAVLETVGLAALIRVRPQVAREVLLACCLKAPERGLSPEELGVELPRGWRATAPMYWQGPFLPFLRQDLENGLEAILRLVNQATANWAALQTTPVGVVVPEAPSAEWLGNVQVYSWYRSGGHPRPRVVVSALMALEKWLYDEIDAGHDVEPVLREILSGSRSVAFAGVLVAAGKKRPDLFTGPLRWLLGCWQLYRWDRLTEEHPLFGFDLGLSFHVGEQLWTVARDWHHLPHRQAPLEGLALGLLLARQDVAEAFAGFRRRWREQIGSGDGVWREEIERLCASFDESNWRPIEPADGAPRWEFRLPEAMQRRRTREFAKIRPALQVANLLEGCRRLLEVRRELDDAVAEELWRASRQVWRTGRARRGKSVLADGRHGEWADAITAAVACLSHLGRGWLDQDPSRRRWCRERLAEVAKEPLSDYADAPLDLVTLWGRPHFTAVAGVAWLAEAPTSRSARRLVAEALADDGGKGNLTRLVLDLGYRQRARLGSEWHRMQTFAVLWSALCYLGRPWPSDASPVGRWRSRLVQWFVAGKVATQQPDWRRLAGRAVALRGWLNRREEVARIDKIAREQFLPVLGTDPGFSLPVLQAAFGWLSGLGEARDKTERQEWMELHRRLLDVDLNIRAHARTEIPVGANGGWPEAPYDEYERWLFPRLVRLIGELPTAAERQVLWEPVLTEQEERRGWRWRGERFVESWFAAAPDDAAGAAAFVKRWREMLDWAFSTAAPLAVGRAELLGIGLRLGMPKLDGNVYGRSLGTLEPLYRRWALGGSLDSPYQARHFARFLVLPASRELLAIGAGWLGGGVVKWRALAAGDRSRAELCEALIPVLRVTWETARGRVQADPALLRAFQDLLAWAVVGGTPEALELEEQVRRTG